MKMRNNDTKFRRFSAAAAIALCVLLGGVTVYAACTHTDFFRSLFGDAGRESTEGHEELIDDGKGGEMEVTYPEREYVPVDEEKAEMLLGEQMSDNPISVEINDHTLTVLSAVRDKNAMTMEFIIECETGVTAYEYNKLSNEAKGPEIGEQATFVLGVDHAGEMVIIDNERSSDTCLYCYDYCIFYESLENGAAPELTISYSDKPYRTLSSDDKLEEKKISIPATEAVSVSIFESREGGALELSPMSCKFDMGKGFGLTSSQSSDTVNLRSVVVNYKDGSSYQVYDRENNIDNTAYLMGGIGENMSEVGIVFNRLVETENVQSVIINGVSYICK